MRTATIIIQPENPDKAVDLQSGGVTHIEILDFLSGLNKLLAQLVIKEYQELTGDQNVDPDKLGEYMDFLRKNGKDLPHG